MKIIRPTAITDQGGSFTRSTTATYTDSSGVLQTAAINVPRVDYKYNTTKAVWECKGVLLEQAATNLLLRSQELDNASWNKQQAGSGVAPVITANAGTAPDGTATADRVDFVAPGGSDFSTLSQGPTTSAGSYVGSFYVKAFAAGDIGKIIGFRHVASGDYLLVTLTNSWTRVESTETRVANSYEITLRPLIGTSSGTVSALIWGTQLETGTVATSYIPTTTASVTRGADTCTGLGYIYSNIAETDYAAWNAGTAYVIGNRVIRTTATTHAIYERVVAGTTATAPEADAVNWIYVGPTNRWAVFDDSPSTLSSNTDTVTYILKPGKVNSIALLELEGTEVAINLYADGALQFSAYNDLLSNDNVGNWYEYFYEPFYYQTSLAITDLINAALLDMPMYTNTIITVTIRKAASTASIGCLVLGIVYELGKTQNGMNVGIIDYSRKDTDTYGNTILVRRKFSRRIRASFFLYSSKVDTVSNLLTQYRATPVVWIAADSLYSSLVVYGFYRDWDIGIPNNIGSTCSIEIEGLT